MSGKLLEVHHRGTEATEDTEKNYNNLLLSPCTSVASVALW